MEQFLREFIDERVVFSTANLPHDADLMSEQNSIKFIQKIIFKHNVLVDLKSTLRSAFSNEEFSVKNDVVKKIVYNLHSVLTSDVHDDTKTHIFCCVFQTFARRCNENETSSVAQFFILLCYVLGLAPEETINGCSINKNNVNNLFGVDISAPTSTSFKILKELLICFAKTTVMLNSTEMQIYHKWLLQLMKNLVCFEPFQSVFMKIYSTFGDIDVKLLEGSFDYLFSKILKLNSMDDETNEEYQKYMVFSLITLAKFQRTVKFISRLLQSLKSVQTKLSCDTILPIAFHDEFSKILGVISTQQSLLLMDILIHNVNDCLVAIQNNSDAESLNLFVSSELLITFLKNVKIFAPSVTSITVRTFIDKLNLLKNCLQHFGEFLFANENFFTNNFSIVNTHLKLCYFCGEIQMLIDCYKDSILESSNEVMSSDFEWQCCISSEQWSKIVKTILKSKIDNYKPICFQLALQKLRTLRFQTKESVADDFTKKLIMSRYSSDVTQFNVVQEVQPEDMYNLMHFLSTKQIKSVVMKTLKQLLKLEPKEVESWLSDSKLQECRTFIVALFSQILKESGNLLKEDLGEKYSPQIEWISDQYFEGSFVNNLEELPEKVNYMLSKGKKLRLIVDKNSDCSESLLKLVEIFKQLPIVYMNDDIKRLGLSFVISIAVVSSAVAALLSIIYNFLNSNTDMSTCCNVGLCVKWLTEMSLDSEDDSMRMKIIEVLVRSCPNSKHGLSQMGDVINGPGKMKNVVPLKILETQVTLYQELGKCWLRAKKRKADNEIIGSYRTKLAKIINQEVQELSKDGICSENYKVLLKVAGLELNKAVKSDDQENISSFIENKFKLYFEFAVNVLKKERDETCLFFLTIVLQSMSKIRPLVPKNSLYEIWGAFKNYENCNWKLFTLNSSEQEFEDILSELFSLTTKFLSLKSSGDSANYLDIWTSIFEGSLDPQKNSAFQISLQLLFDHLTDSHLLIERFPVTKVIYIMRFFSFCVSNDKIILTSQMLDVIIDFILHYHTGIATNKEFQTLFTTQAEIGSAILSRKFAWNKSKVHMTYLLFQHSVECLMKRWASESQANNDVVIMLSTCAFSVEKWASLTINKQKDFARISAYFITTIVSAIASVTVPPVIKIHLVNSLNHFLSMSDSHTVSYLMRVLKPGYQQVFSSLYDQFTKYHRYTGKV